MGIDAVFTGLLMDNNFKGYYAQDVVRVARMRGLLPASYKIVPSDYAHQVSDFCRKHIAAEYVEGTIERRETFCEHHMARKRGSPGELA